MTNYYTTLLDNNHPSFTFQCSCLNFHPETTNNLSYTLLTNGAINTVGATRVSWYYRGQTNFIGSSTTSGMAYEYSSRLISQERSSGYALNDLRRQMSPTGAELWMNYVVFNIYGDPEMGLFTYGRNYRTPCEIPNSGVTCCK